MKRNGEQLYYPQSGTEGCRASGLLSSASGRQVYCENMLFVAMCSTGNAWRMARSWMRTTLNIC